MLWDAIRFCRDFNIPFIPPGASESGKVSAGWIGVSCPNPNCSRNNQSDYGGFNIPGGYYSCWNCGGHKLQTVIRWFLKVGNHEAQNLVYNYSGTGMMSSALNIKKKKAGQVSKVEIPGSKLLKKHRDYLRGRNFDPDFLIEKYDLRAIGNKTNSALEREYKNRIIIPIYNRHGKIISYQGRDVSGISKIRYKGCHIDRSVLNYKHTLYGWPYAVEEQCALVEGVVDQWNMGDGFLCTFGTALTEFQIREISSFKRIFILFDPEVNAQKLAEKTANKLASLNREVEIVNIGSDCDPGELKQSDVKYIRRELGFI